MIKWPDDLIVDIARRRCVLYLGAGISANSKSRNGNKSPATWKVFLINILEKEKNQIGVKYESIMGIIDKGDYLLACEVIVNILGKTFTDLVEDEFRRPGYKFTKIHETIYRLDSRVVITPNIDKIYDQCAGQLSDSTIVVKNYYDKDLASYLRKPDYLIIKAHGDVDTPDRVVFTHEQYNQMRSENADFYRIMEALLLTHTFVFLGCGINDPDIQLMLENHNFSFVGCKPHYFVTQNDKLTPEVIKSIERNRNLKTIVYEHDEGGHINLCDGLQDLAEKVEEERNKIAQRTTW
ncbi:SIR2 family protein [uncultured Selenomonas sp.]|uniref:SIR2 family NAD-dependent protein deacylase n=1 Tax=uncultured Selenomonas sp. TaxID=159275 RepID=UPI0028E6B925|nr:SIR2 family protein [uncultured Selenomonas sp.]